MIDYEQFKKMKEYKEIGLSKEKTRKHLKITMYEINKWWHLDEKEYFEKQSEATYQMDPYRDFIIHHLKICPQMHDMNIRYKLRENFPDFNVPRSSFQRYMRKLREQTGFVRPFERQVTVRPDLPPGYEAQVDFGQFKMRNLYDREVRIYFFVMVLSYSRMKFVYFSHDPFTTATAIEAHRMAFQYFGGRTQTILYDQDRVFVISENLGNIVFVKEFEDFVRKAGFQVVLCRPSDPQTKGKVEEVVKHVKESFLKGRIYSGIDSLNSACLSWLDLEGNGKVHLATKKKPRDMFREEVKYLQSVKPEGRGVGSVFSVTMDNYISYKDNRYEIPQEAMLEGCRVRVVEDDGNLLIYRSATDDLVCKHPLCTDVGRVISLEGKKRDIVSMEELEDLFADSWVAETFFNAIHEGNPRYMDSQCKRLLRMTNYYSIAQLEDGMAYCSRMGECTVHELTSYLIFRFGESVAAQFLNTSQMRNYKRRVAEIKEEQNGRY
ncbi:MAG: IS21 family transposase [Clostridia bacterium]|nr:IS21 family transposase [Clostridia bacterium]